MRKLLLADDSVTIQRVIELTFSGEDIQVVAVNDGEQAIARIPAEQPDVVLADIGMPRKGGYDVAAFVKGRPDLSHIPVLLLAGAFEPVDQTRAEQVGADGVLIKPFEPRQVIERVKELLASVRPTISAEVVPEPIPIAPAAVTDAGVIETTAVEATVEATAVETPAFDAAAAPPAEAAAPPPAPVEPRAPATAIRPQPQTLDELFESLNQALTERTGTAPATPTEHPAVPAPTPPARPAATASPEFLRPPAAERAPDAVPQARSSRWPDQQDWLTPTMHDDSHSPRGFDRFSDSVGPERVGPERVGSDSVGSDSAPFGAAAKPTPSATSLDDYFDRLSAAFSHTRTAIPSATLPERVEDFGSVAPAGPPPASHEWLGQVREPQGLSAFDSGEDDDNPILGAVSTLMARSTRPDHAAPLSDHPRNGAYTTPVEAHGGIGGIPPGRAEASSDLADIVTERVIARLLPELTESLRRLVQQEIARNRY